MINSVTNKGKIKLVQCTRRLKCGPIEIVDVCLYFVMNSKVCVYQ